MDSSPLKIGLMLDGLEVPFWISRVAQLIEQRAGLELALIVLREDKSLAAKTSPKKSLLYRYYDRIDSRRGGNFTFTKICPIEPAGRTTLLHVVPRATTADSELIGPEDIAKIRKFNLDVMINFSFRGLGGETLRCAKYGVWEYHHGDPAYDHPASNGFWEVFDGRPASEVRLKVLTGNENVEYLLSKTAIRTHETSPSINRSRLELAGISLYEYMIRWLVTVRPSADEFFKRLVESPRSTARRRTSPSNIEMLNFVVANIAKIIRGRVRSGGRVEQWSFGVTKENPLKVREGLSFEQINWFVPDRFRFLADPFMIAHAGKKYIFIEDYPYESRLGHISVTEYRDDGTFSQLQPVLQQNFHLSFPFVFEHEGQIYMLPEQATSKEIALYKAEQFPDKWEKCKVLIDDFPGVDNILFRHSDKWWLFTSFGEYGNQDNNLHVFFADNLFGPFTPHALNPIKLSLRASRMAGKVFEANGMIIRPAQNCVRRYGGSVVLNEIVELTPDTYREREIVEIKPAAHSLFGEAFHTINCMDGLTVVAGVRYVKSPFPQKRYLPELLVPSVAHRNRA